MPDVHVLPDAEKLVIDWALTTADVNDLVDGRIYSAVPKNPEWPLVRVTRIGGVPTSRLLWLDQASMQIDVWGGPKSTARLIAETFRAWISADLPGSYEAGAVTAVEVGGLTWLPDESYAPARPRYSFDAAVYYHPPTS